jgi:glycerate kinase
MQSAIKRKNVLLAFDKFKDSIQSKDICDIINNKINLRLGEQGVVCHQMPISDGGDGFVEFMSYHFKGDPAYEISSVSVKDPLQRQVQGIYLINRSTRTAYLEVANTSGLLLLKKEERNPFVTSSVVRYR